MMFVLIAGDIGRGSGKLPDRQGHLQSGPERAPLRVEPEHHQFGSVSTACDR